MTAEKIDVGELALAERRRRFVVANAIAITKKMQEVSPSTPAEYLEIAGGCVAFNGTDAQATCAVGIGSAGPVSTEQIEHIEGFLQSRGSTEAVFHISDSSDPSLLPLLVARGYDQGEVVQRWVKVLDTKPVFQDRRDLQVSIVAENMRDLWAIAVAQGYGGFLDRRLVDIFITLGFAEHCQPFIAMMNGLPVGGGVLTMRLGLAALRTASTVPAARNRGVQKSLIEARINAAFGNAELVSCATGLTGPSATNMERFGFSKDQLTRVFFKCMTR